MMLGYTLFGYIKLLWEKIVSPLLPVLLDIRITPKKDKTFFCLIIKIWTLILGGIGLIMKLNWRQEWKEVLPKFGYQFWI